MLTNLLSKANMWAVNKRAELEAEDGQGTVEYVLVLGVIVVGVIGLWNTTDLSSVFTSMKTELEGLF